MKIIIADTYLFYIHNSRNTRFPREYKNHKIIWSMRKALVELWRGNVTEVVVPKSGTPGYDFPSFVQGMLDNGDIKVNPKFKYYELTITKK